MKRTITLSLFVAFLTLSLSAQDTATIIGAWKYQSDTNGADKKTMFYGNQFEFKNDGTSTRVVSGNPIKGTWSSTDGNKTILLTEDKDSQTLNIVELSEKNWYSNVERPPILWQEVLVLRYLQKAQKQKSKTKASNMKANIY